MAGIDGKHHGHHRENRDLRSPHINGSKLGSPGKHRGTHQNRLEGLKTFLGGRQSKSSTKRHNEQ
jgi:hypothetical protein